MDGIEETIKEEALGSRFDELYRKVLSGCKITKEEKEFLLKKRWGNSKGRFPQILTGILPKKKKDL